MSFAAPANIILRQSVVGSEGLWTKMFDPPTDSPPTPERLDPTLIGLDGNPLGGPYAGVRANPVPSVMEAALYLAPRLAYTVTRSLMHGMDIATWNGGAKGGKLKFFVFADDDLQGKDAQGNNFSAGQFPAPTVRVPRGAIFHGDTAAQGPPPHTIHWHGIEPTPMNDGVGHCSMELGHYTYQWQPNFIGTYFYHCHRNTMQHFEFGLAGLMLFDPPDAFFASILTDGNGIPLDPLGNPADRVTGHIGIKPGYPLGHGRPEPGFTTGRFRTAANLSFSGLPTFPGYIPGDPIQGVNVPDPWGVNPGEDPFLKFPTYPHAFTVPYDVECLWSLDDRDSVWSDNASSATATFPASALLPPTPALPVPVTGVNDQFDLNPGTNGFFNFNDFNADYWFVTGVPVPAVKGGSATIPNGLVIPPQLNSGVSGTLIDIQANKGETVFIRCLNAAYNSTKVTFPVDVVIIEWDGRALGVPPLNRYTRPILVKAGTPIVQSTARRWGAILRVPIGGPSVSTPVKVEFLDTRSGEGMTLKGGGTVVMTAYIPCHIS
jgi:hypothetical protein